MEDCIGTFERGTDKFDEVVQGLVAAAGGSGPQLQKALEKVKTIIISHDPRRAGRPQRKFVLQDGRTADSIRRLLEWAREGALASTEQQLSASASPTATFVDTSGSNPCASSSKLLPGAAASTSSWQADAVATVSAAAAGTKPGGLEVSIDEPGPSSSMFQQQLPEAVEAAAALPGDVDVRDLQARMTSALLIGETARASGQQAQATREGVAALVQQHADAQHELADRVVKQVIHYQDIERHAEDVVAELEEQQAEVVQRASRLVRESEITPHRVGSVLAEQQQEFGGGGHQAAAE